MIQLVRVLGCGFVKEGGEVALERFLVAEVAGVS
jgi:hypothetical protein